MFAQEKWIGDVRRLLVLTSVVLPLALPASAAAGWSRPYVVTKRSAADQRVALSPRHGGVVGWRGATAWAMALRRLGPDGLPRGRGRRVSQVLDVSFPPRPSIAVNRRGAAVMIWARDRGNGNYALLGRHLSSRGRLGAVRMLVGGVPAGGAEDLPADVVLGPGGDAIVVFGSQRGLHLRRFAADGSLGPVIDVPDEGGQDAAPSLEVDPSGRAVLAWVHSGRDRYGIRAARIGADGGLGAAQDVSEPHEYWSGGGVELAVDARARATFVWAPPAAGLDANVLARRLAGGQPEGLNTLGASDATHGAVGVAVGVDARGVATVAWRDPGPGDGTAVIKARRVGANGLMGPPAKTLSSTGELSVPQVAVDGLGNATVAWDRITASRAEVDARRFGPRGRLGSMRRLSSPSAPLTAASSVQLAAGARVTVATWSSAGIAASRFLP